MFKPLKSVTLGQYVAKLCLPSQLQSSNFPSTKLLCFMTGKGVNNLPRVVMQPRPAQN